jgi:hypothetical protein
MNRTAVLYALVSAALFGISTPATKALVGTVDPIVLAGLLYCGAWVYLESLPIFVASTLRGIFREGRIKEIAEYCESDVVNTYQLWLRHELFCGKLTESGFQARRQTLPNSSRCAAIQSRIHLTELIS